MARGSFRLVAVRLIFPALLGIVGVGCKNTTTASPVEKSQPHSANQSATTAPVLAPSSAPTPHAAARYPVKKSLDPGEVGFLWLGNNEAVVIAVDSAALSRFTQLATAKDVDGVAQMALAGRIFSVNAGTRCRMIDRGIFTSEIRVTEGPQQGRSGFIPTEWVYREAAAPSN